MHRTQIQLDDWQYQILKTKAEREGKSLSSLVREAVTVYLGKGRRRRPGAGLTDIEGIGEDPGVAGRDHDRILYGAKGRRS
jgi:hypothetical protein